MTTDGYEYQVNINGIDVDARFSRCSVREIFLPLLEELTALYRRKGSRVLVMLAAPPGAGKSTLLSFLKKLSEEREDLEPVRIIGMDGFHRRQEYLLQHTVCRDGEEIPMVKIKGAPETFDLQKLTESVRRAASGEICAWPVYDRLLHNPVEDAVTVDGGIVLLEGNYLLLDQDGWRKLSGYADYTVSIRAGEDLLRSRLIERRIRTGVEREDAERFVDFSDMANVRLCLSRFLPADLSLCLDEAGEWHRAEEKEAFLKLEIFLPEACLPSLRAALREADAGHIGRYDSCLSVSRVMSSWRPLPGTHPFSGTPGEVSEDPELKAEVTIRASRLARTMAAIRRVHPYEEPAVNVIPLAGTMLDYL